MGDGINVPYNKEDVLRLIEENVGIAQGLDLSGKEFEKEIDLRGFRLQMINLESAVLEKSHLEGALLTGANLEGAFLEGAHLEGARMSGANLKNANLVGARLEKARLTRVNLEGAELYEAHLEEAGLVDAYLDKTRLSGAHLEGVNMFGARIFPSTELSSVDWGTYVLGEEKEGVQKGEIYQLWWAINIYRNLKTWYTQHGLDEVAAKFYYREMEAKRKSQYWKTEPLSKLWSWITRLLCGYGEKPERVGISAAVIIFGLAVAYYFGGLFNSSISFLGSLYYSTVSFVALGYGSWVSEPIGWTKYMGAAEAAMGVFMMALFLVTFTRKMTR